MADEVSIHVEASPDEIYGLVSDVTRVGEWSPECQRCAWLGGATGPAPGARFKGWNRRGLMRWTTTCTVVTAEPGREFAFEVDRSRMRWGYRMAADGEGCTVTEYREHLGDVSPLIKLVQLSGLLGRDRERLMVEGMTQTLERVKAIAEAN